MTESIETKLAANPIGHYPHAKRVGNLLFLSGIGPRSALDNSIAGNVYDDHGMLLSYDIEQQCHAVFANVKAVLQASGVQWAELIDITVYLTNMGKDFPVYNQIWAEYFPDSANAPCRTTLGINALPTQIAIELKCIALAEQKSCC